MSDEENLRATEHIGFIDYDGPRVSYEYAPMTIIEKKRLAGLVFALWNAVLLGGDSIAARQQYERMSNPQPGDYVFEASTIGRLLHNGYADQTLWQGQFVKYLRTEWSIMGPYIDPYVHEVYVCEQEDGSLFRWTNASLKVAPIYKALDDHYYGSA